MERVNGVDPSYQPWQGRALPLSYTRVKEARSLLPTVLLICLFWEDQCVKNNSTFWFLKLEPNSTFWSVGNKLQSNQLGPRNLGVCTLFDFDAYCLS